MGKIVMLLLMLFATTISSAQSFEPQIVPGPFWKPRLIADERGYLQKPIVIFADKETQWMVPEISELRTIFPEDLKRVTMLYSYNRTTEETTGYVLDIDRGTGQFALFGRAMQEKYFQHAIRNADKTWSAIIEQYEQYVSKTQQQLLKDAETRLKEAETRIKQQCPDITDADIQNYRQHPAIPTDNNGCPPKAPVQK